jgi:hypothetical protein
MLRKRFTAFQKSFLKRPKTFTLLGIVLLVVIGLFVISEPQITVWTDPKPTVKWIWPPQDRTMAPFWIGSANEAELDTSLHEALAPLCLLGGALGTLLPGPGWLGVAVGAVAVLILDWTGVLHDIKITEHELYIYNIPVQLDWLDGDRNIKTIRINMHDSAANYEFTFDQPGRPSFRNTYDFVYGVGFETIVGTSIGLDWYHPDGNPLWGYEGVYTTVSFDVYIEDYDGNIYQNTISRHGKRNVGILR